MRVSRTISTTLMVVFLTQSVFLGSGLLGFCLESASKICKCNHGSKKEIHKNSEDELFTEASGQTDASNSKTKKEKTSSHTVKASCHDAKAGEAHLCSCKKNKKEASNLRNHHQVLVSIDGFHFFESPSEIISSSIASENRTLDGFSFSLLKPPRS